jgi:hypothetical protein
MSNRQDASLCAADKDAVSAQAPRTQRPGPAAPQDRSALRLATAERVIAEAFADSRRVDRDTIDAAFVAARDCLAEAKELSRQARTELALARRERFQAQREREIDRKDRLPRRSRASSALIVADAPGARFCPDPQNATTDAELMDALRAFWVWTGRPSYRIMAEQCGNRYAASTLHGALRSDKLPGLDMLLAIVLGCRGATEHQQAFATAWRQLQTRNQSTGWAETETWILRPVRDTA